MCVCVCGSRARGSQPHSSIPHRHTNYKITRQVAYGQLEPLCSPPASVPMGEGSTSTQLHPIPEHRADCPLQPQNPIPSMHGPVLVCVCACVCVCVCVFLCVYVCALTLISEHLQCSNKRSLNKPTAASRVAASEEVSCCRYPSSGSPCVQEANTAQIHI